MEFIKQVITRVGILVVKHMGNRKRFGRSALVCGALGATALTGLALGAVTAGSEQGTVQSAQEIRSDSSAGDDSDEESDSEEPLPQENQIPLGFLGVIRGIDVARASRGPYNPIGSSGDQVLVGKITAVREEVSHFKGTEELQEKVETIGSQADILAGQTLMSDHDYETMLSIVEAEAGGEDIEGRILVANVIMNRVAHKDFPNSVTEVVWDREGGSAQFSPTADGRIFTVEVQDSTREAVNRAIDGEDLSRGALFFLDVKNATKKNIDWFDKNLKFLFKKGVHSFYTYP